MRSLTYFATFLLVLGSAFVAANEQEDDVKMSRPTLGQTGKVFSVSFSPGAKLVKVQLTGKTMASLDPDRVTLLGRSYPRKGKPYDLKFLWTGSHYRIVNKIDATDQIELKVQ